MKIHIGTSGFGYKAWKGKFYPKDLPNDQMLRHYSDCFAAVEINNTFYKMPEPSTFEGWATQVSADFKFAIKAPQRITHFQRLQNVTESVTHLFSVATVFGDRLGPVLFQLPPNFKKDAPRLRDFLKVIPPAYRIAFEFRNQSWFDEEILEILRDHQAALCTAEDQNDLKVPLATTADWGYLRLRRLDYTQGVLTDWLKQIVDQGWREAFVFFKHEDEAIGVQFAKTFLELAQANLV